MSRGAGVPTAILTCALLSVACGAGDTGSAGSPPVTIRDSAGIEIVRSSEAAWSEGDGIRLSQAPLLRIGEQVGEPAYLFSRIADVQRLPDGRMLVLDADAMELRVFGPDGRHIRSMGRSGDGPGELSFAMELEVVPGGMVEIHDHMTRVRFTLDGELVSHRSVDLGRVLELAGGLGDCQGVPRFVGDDFHVCYEDNSAPSVQGREPGPWPMTQTLIRLPMSLDVVDTIGVFLEDLGHVVFRGGQKRIAFAPGYAEGYLTWGGDPPVLAFTRTDRYEIEVRDLDGTLMRILRRQGGMRALTAEEVERGLSTLARMLFDDPSRTAAAASEFPPPESISTLTWLIVDEANRIWARAEDPAAQPSLWYELFDADGGFLGRVDVPEGFEPFQITREHMVGVGRDEYDVQYVEIYALEGG